MPIPLILNVLLYIHVCFRLENWPKSRAQELVIKYFRAAQLIHCFAMEVFHYLLPAILTASEMVILFSLFLAIRLNTYTDEQLFTVLAICIGGISFFTLKQALEYAAKVMESSQAFSKIPFLKRGCHFEIEDRLFLASCKPLVISVGGTFSITNDTFPTISQNIILVNLINLLITF